jgi:hypothetical protein
VVIGPKGPRTDDDLVATVTGAGSTYQYSWFQDGNARADLAGATVPASETAKGETWKLEVTSDTGSKGTGQITVQNTPPVATSISISPEAPGSTDDITATSTTEDADGDTVTVAYDWNLDGTSSSTTTETLSAKETEKGQHLIVSAIPSDDEEAGDPITLEVDIGNGAPFIRSVTLSPTKPTITDDIVVTVQSKDPENDPVSYAYAWYVDGTLYQVGPVGTLSAGSALVGQTVYVEVTPNDGFVDGAVGTSNTVTVVDGGTVVGTGQAAVFYQGEVIGDKTTMTSGKYGLAYYPYDFASDTSDLTNNLCYAWIDLKAGGTISSCANCDFSYSISADVTTGSSGSSCAALIAGGATGADEAVLGSYWGPGGPYEVTGGFGYAASSPTYGIPVVYFYYKSSWSLFAYQYGNGTTSSNGGNFYWTRPGRDATTGYEVYYNY